MESNDAYKNSEHIENTELDNMITKQDPDTKIVDGNSNKSKLYQKNQNGLWLSMKIFVIIILILLIIFIILFCIMGGIMRQNYQNLNNTYSALVNDKNSTAAWNRCEKIAANMNKCFTRPKCISPRLIDTSRNATPKADKVRLPLTVIPTFYDIILQPFIHNNNPRTFFFNGSCTILATINESTSSFMVHSNKLMVNDSLIEVLDSADAKLNIKNITYDFARQWFLIEMDKDLVKDTTIKIVFGQFRKAFEKRNTLKGWYLSSYKENGVEKYLATSQLQPTDARMVFPCFDEPLFKAKFQVTIIRHKDFHALANMDIKRSTKLDNEWFKDEFKVSLKMPTYLLAFVVSQFKSLEKTDKKGRKIRVWSRPELINNAKYSLEIGIKILEFFEEYFEIDYPLNKTDMVAVPDFSAGAMENWGLIIYREVTMLWNSSTGSADSRGKVATVVSHEIAHQWFGNLVTLRWWSDLWLNEGFASFVEYVGVAHAEPTWSMDQQFVMNELQKVLNTDSLVTSHPVLMTVNHPDEINEIFDSISYNKGASVLRMMEAFLGKETYRKGLKRYLKKHQYKNTVHNDLWNALTKQAKDDNKNIPVKKIMDTWIKQMGYPLVTVKKKGDSQLVVSQKHFLVPPPSNRIRISSPYNFTWVVPLTYTTKYDRAKNRWNNTEDVTWLSNKSITIDLKNSRKDNWYIFNVQQAGFYRVNYDEKNWQNIINQLLTDHKKIYVNNRAQIIDDLYNLAKVGKVSFILVLNMTKYLKQERDLIPWKAAQRIFSFFDSIMLMDENYGDIQAYLKNLISPMYATIDWTNTKEDTNHIQNLLRPIIVHIACFSGHKGCQKEAVNRFKKYVESNGTYMLPSSLRYIIFCIGIQNSGAKYWKFLFDRLQFVQDDETETANIYKALFCTKEIWLMNKFLTSMPNTMKAQPIMETLNSMSKNPIGAFVFANFLSNPQRNISNVQISGPNPFALRLYVRKCQLIAECMTTIAIEKIQDYLKNNEIHEKDYKLAYDQIKQNRKLLVRIRKTIVPWLKKVKV